MFDHTEAADALLKTYTHSSLSPMAKQTSRKKHALKLWCHWPAMMSLLPVGSAVSCTIGWLRQTVGEHCWGISSIHPKAEKKRVRVFVGVTTPHWSTEAELLGLCPSFRVRHYLLGCSLMEAFSHTHTHTQWNFTTMHTIKYACNQACTHSQTHKHAEYGGWEGWDGCCLPVVTGLLSWWCRWSFYCWLWLSFCNKNAHTWTRTLTPLFIDACTCTPFKSSLASVTAFRETKK